MLWTWKEIRTAYIMLFIIYRNLRDKYLKARTNKTKVTVSDKNQTLKWSTMTVIAFVFQLKSLKSKWRLVSVSGAAEQTCSKYVLRLSSQRSPSRERSTWMNRLRTPLTEWRRWRMWCRSLPQTVRTFWTPWRRPRSRKRCLIILTYQHRLENKWAYFAPRCLLILEKQYVSWQSKVKF